MKNPESCLMGLSNVSRLQQSRFLPPWNESYLGYFRGRHLIIYKGRKNYKKAQELTERQLDNLTKKKFTGELSRKSQQKIINIVQNWIETVDHVQAIKKTGVEKGVKQVVLITLTLSAKQQHDDRVIKRTMLNRFLISLARSNDRVKYLWKAETQQNGNIHFHILVDEYFDKDWINQLWNSIQFDNGYISQELYKNKDKIIPSTRIEALRDKYDSTAYIAKYISKNEGIRKVEGRLWGCSKELQEIKKAEIVLSKSEVLDLVNSQVEYENDLFTTEYCTIISNIRDHQTLKMNLFAKHNYVELILQSNIDKLHLRPLCPDFCIQDSEWYYDIMAESNALDVSYSLNNGLLFPDML